MPSIVSFQGTHSILDEESHIKDALSRIVVEMIKREWPQHWPDMLKEMETLTSQGVSNLCGAGSSIFPHLTCFLSQHGFNMRME